MTIQDVERLYRVDIEKFVNWKIRDREESACITQRVMVKAAIAISRGFFVGSPKQWLFKVANRMCIDVKRQQKRNPTARCIEYLDRSDSGQALDAVDVRNDIRRAYNLLPEDERDIFRMVVIKGFSADEVAEIIRRDPQTVRRQLRHAKARMREQLKDMMVA